MQAGGHGFDSRRLHHMFHWSKGRAPASEAGDVGSIPAWDRLAELLLKMIGDINNARQVQ